MEIQKLLAKNYTPVDRTEHIRWIVIHTMEAPEKPDTAEAVARWFASKGAPGASAHFCVDCDSIIECVPPRLIAWHAKGGNKLGIGIELAGRAGQGPEGWEDAYSRETLANAAWLCGQLAKQYDIPPRRLTDDEIRGGVAKGFVGHGDITRAKKIVGGHWDPGPNFPWAQFLLEVEGLMTVEPPEWLTRYMRETYGVGA